MDGLLKIEGIIDFFKFDGSPSWIDVVLVEQDIDVCVVCELLTYWCFVAGVESGGVADFVAQCVIVCPECIVECNRFSRTRGQCPLRFVRVVQVRFSLSFSSLCSAFDGVEQCGAGVSDSEAFAQEIEYCSGTFDEIC